MNKTYDDDGKLIGVELDPGEKHYLCKQNNKLLKEQKENERKESESSKAVE